MKTFEFKTVDEYIAGVNPQHQEILERVRAIAKECAPGSVEKIAYRMPTVTLNGKVVVHFHAAKEHLGFYPEEDGVGEFMGKLTEYKTAKGAIQFPYKKPIPYDLIREIIQFKVAKAT